MICYKRVSIGSLYKRVSIGSLFRRGSKGSKKSLLGSRDSSEKKSRVEKEACKHAKKES